MLLTGGGGVFDHNMHNYIAYYLLKTLDKEFFKLLTKVILDLEGSRIFRYFHKFSASLP